MSPICVNKVTLQLYGIINYSSNNFLLVQTISSTYMN
nr:MAG TPA: hypothetical protein [Caudoviricetes sp.]DAU44319.1 MAG TPA: hypothetical protein [Caudoviricetes sp.]